MYATEIEDMTSFSLLQKVKWRLFDMQLVWAENRAEMVTATKKDVSSAS